MKEKTFCAECKFENSCGYSPKASFGHRTKMSFVGCAVTNKPYDNKKSKNDMK